VSADAQLKATDAPGFGEAVAGFMNPGGIRADLSHESSEAGESAGNVTYGEGFTVQPFGNSLVNMTLTSAQIEILLEQQFTGCGAESAPTAFNYPDGDGRPDLRPHSGAAPRTVPRRLSPLPGSSDGRSKNGTGAFTPVP
jgi:2',3'-cyclic-nucleotide 2'-phosphodiesterase (5'-nucleotidase family)